MRRARELTPVKHKTLHYNKPAIRLVVVRRWWFVGRATLRNEWFLVLRAQSIFATVKPNEFGAGLSQAGWPGQAPRNTVSPCLGGLTQLGSYSVRLRLRCITGHRSRGSAGHKILIASSPVTAPAHASYFCHRGREPKTPHREQG